MGLLDFLKKAQEKVEGLQERVEGLQKKAEAITTQIEKDPIATLSGMMKRDAVQHKPSKRDVSVENISKQTFAQRDNMRKNGFKEYEFIANRDCCPVCKRLNGKHFPIAKLEIGVNAPPMHESCSCSIAAYEDEEEYEKWLNSL